MLKSHRLRQLQKLAVSYPQYFRHNYLKELDNAGYEEVVPDNASENQTPSPTGHGKKVLAGASLVKAKPQAANEELAKVYGGEIVGESNRSG